MLRLYWSIIERQNCCDKTIQSFTSKLFTTSISIKQTKYLCYDECAQGGMKETRLLFNSCAILKVVRIVLDKVELVFLTRRSHIM